MELHAFVAMPFGVKEGRDFDRIYTDYIKPALSAAGFRVFRADQEQRAGSIQADMFQELLLADLVVADLSIDNPNVWYELGVRHALRARGVVLIQSQRDYQPFDIYTDRKLRYRLKDGIPDPEFLARDRAALTQMAEATLAAWHGRPVSPVYTYLDYLREPDWKTLSMAGATVSEHGFRYREWSDRVQTACCKRRPGDIMVLAGEAPIQALALEAYRLAGKALLDAGQPGFALEQIDKALALDPDDLVSRQLKAVVLGRLGRLEEALSLVGRLLEDDDRTAENWALLGRIEKEHWIDVWRIPGATPQEMQAAAVHACATLAESSNGYERGYLCNVAHYYSGMNALTLRWLLAELGGYDVSMLPLAALEGGVRCALASALATETPLRKDYWARASLAEVETLCGEPEQVRRAWERALAARPDWFELDSSYQQLCILRDLGVRATEVDIAARIVECGIQRLHCEPPPAKVFLFSGHMVDRPERAVPRFPNDAQHIDIARAAIARQLDALEIGADSLAICGGACGGDLLFADVALQRGARLQMHLPFAEPQFLQASVSFAGGEWQDLYFKTKAHPRTGILVMPTELGPAPASAEPYARNNLWQLYTALSQGADKVRFVCLWDGGEADGPGGTQQMYTAVRDRSGQVYVLDTKALW